MKNMNEKQMLIISVTVFSLIALGLLWGIYTKHNEWTKIVADVARKTEDNDTKQRDKVEKLDQMKSDVAQLRIDKLTKFDIKLPSEVLFESSFQTTIEQINAYANEFGVEIGKSTHLARAKAGKKKKKKRGAAATNFVEFEIKLELDSQPFENVVQFLNALENYDRILEVKLFEINSSRGSGSRYNYKVTVSGYTFKEKVKPKKKAAKKRTAS